MTFLTQFTNIVYKSAFQHNYFDVYNLTLRQNLFVTISRLVNVGKISTGIINAKMEAKKTISIHQWNTLNWNIGSYLKDKSTISKSYKLR